MGGSVLNNPFGEQNPVIALPYLAVAVGEGALEYNFSVQWGLRGGVKLGLGPGLALDAGLTVPPGFWDVEGWPTGMPVVLDGGVILGRDGFYFSPRLHLIGVPGSGGGLGYQLSLGAYRRDWVAEVGAMGGFGGGFLLSLSAAWRFGTAP